MTVKEHCLHNNKVKEERIKFRVVLLTCLEVYQTMQEAASAERERERRKLIAHDGGSSSGNGGGGCSLDMIEVLPPQMLQIVNMLRGERANERARDKEEFESKIEELENKIESSTRVSNSKIEILRGENEKLKEKVRVLSGEKKIDRNEKHLNGPLAYKMITAFELWREIAAFL